MDFNYLDFWNGFTIWAFQMRFDGIFLIFILPLIIGLFITARRGFPHADSISLLITGIIFAMPLLTAITEFNLHVYRNVPVNIFFAIGVGVLLSHKIKKLV